MVLFILPAAADLERPIQPKKIQAVPPTVATFTNGVALEATNTVHGVQNQGKRFNVSTINEI